MRVIDIQRHSFTNYWVIFSDTALFDVHLICMMSPWGTWALSGAVEVETGFMETIYQRCAWLRGLTLLHNGQTMFWSLYAYELKFGLVDDLTRYNSWFEPGSHIWTSEHDLLMTNEMLHVTRPMTVDSRSLNRDVKYQDF